MNIYKEVDYNRVIDTTLKKTIEVIESHTAKEIDFEFWKDFIKSLVCKELGIEKMNVDALTGIIVKEDTDDNT